jgi:hypothetical protein
MALSEQPTPRNEEPPPYVITDRPTLSSRNYIRTLISWNPVLSMTPNFVDVRIPVAVERFTVGPYTLNQGDFMEYAPTMHFSIEMAGVSNRPLTQSWDVIAEQGWSIWDPAELDLIWRSVPPSREYLYTTDVDLMEIVPNAMGMPTSKRSYMALHTSPGMKITGNLWQASNGWAAIAFRPMSLSTPGPVMSFEMTQGIVSLYLNGSVLEGRYNGETFGLKQLPYESRNLVVAGLLVMPREIQAVISINGSITVLRRQFMEQDVSFHVVSQEFGGDDSPEMTVYTLASGSEEPVGERWVPSQFLRVIDQIFGFLSW